MSQTKIQSYADLMEAIENENAVVGVIGLGYVGLPLINAFFHAGFKTLGFDVDPKKVDQLKRGESYISHIDSSNIAAWVEADKFDATIDMDRITEADVILICVPTPLSDSRDPDLKYVEATSHSIAKALRKNQLIVLESTTYPGTTRDVVLPILETSGLNCGTDFFVAYSPEREDPGNAVFDAQTIPKVVGGIDDTSLQLADKLYSKAVSATVPVSSCEVAEACKILENTYRSVNIAMVNELKVLFHRIGINVWDVIEAAKTKPFGFQAFYPGPGLGGHCIPIDPFYLSWVARKHEMPTRFIELAGEINASMPHFVVDRISEALNHAGKPIRGTNIGIMGVAYKKDIDDHRESPAFKIMEILIERGAVVTYTDPHIPVVPPMRSFDLPDLKSEEPTNEYFSGLDLAVVITNHTTFDIDAIVKHAPIIVDTRNATANCADQDKIWKA